MNVATSGADVRISFPVSNEDERYIFTVCGSWRLRDILDHLPHIKNIIVMRTCISIEVQSVGKLIQAGIWTYMLTHMATSCSLTTLTGQDISELSFTG